jgi:TP901 family phage tail tape measure protein
MSTKTVILDIDFNVKQTANVTKAASELAKLEKAVEDATEGTLEYVEATRRLEAAQKQASAEQGKFGKSIQNTEKTAGSFTKTINGAAKSLAAFLAIGSGIELLRGAVNTIIDFDKSLASLSAITGATGGDLDFYAEQAREIGRSSTLGANEAVEAFKLIGSAAPQLLQNSESLASVTKEAVTLAEASGITLPEAAATLGNALNAFNLPAEDASRIINTFAAASQQGAREIPFVTQAIEKFGGTAAAAGIGVEESVAAIELLGKTSSDASGIGTNLRNVIVILRQEAAKQGREFKGLSGELEQYGDKLDDVNFLAEIFGRENLQAASNLIAGRNELVNFTESITGTETAYEQAATNTATLDAEIKRLGNTFTDVVLGFRESTGGFSTAVRFLRENLGTIIRVVGVLVTGFVGYRAALLATTAATAVARTATTAYTVTKALFTGGVRAASVALQGFNTAIRANPIGLIVGGLTAAAAAFFAFRGEAEDATKAQKEFNQSQLEAERIRKNISSIQQQIAILPDLDQDALDSLRQRIQSELSSAEAINIQVQAFDQSVEEPIELLKERIRAAQREFDQLPIGDQSVIAAREINRLQAQLENLVKTRDEIRGENIGVAIGGEESAAQIDQLRQSLELVDARIGELKKRGGIKPDDYIQPGTIRALEEQVKRLRKAIVEDLRIDSKDFEPTVKAYNAAVDELADANKRLSPEDSPVEGSIEALSARANELSERVRGLRVDSEEFAGTVTDLIDAQLELQKAQALLTPVDRSAQRAAEIQEEQRHQLALLGITEASEEEKLQLQLQYAQDRLTALQKDNKAEIVEFDKAANAIVELETQLAAVRSDIANKAAEEARQRQQEELEGIAQVLNQSFTSLNTLVGLQQQSNQQLLSLQQERVNQAVAIADQGNAALLKAEQDRLNELNRKREQFVRAQQVLAAAQLISESSLAIARAAAEGGVAAPFTIAATLIALTAGLAQARAVAQASAAGFKKGGYTGDGGASDEAGVVHKGEFVIDKPTTQALGLRNKSMLDFKREFMGRKELPKSLFKSAAGVELSERAAAQIVKAIESKPVPSFSFSEDGIFTASERTRKRSEKAKRLAR